MPEDREALAALAGQVREALGSTDPAGFSDLLDPNVRWGAPDDNVSGCHNRKQVLAWDRRARDAGVRVTVTEVEVADDSLLVGLSVVGNDDEAGQGGEALRWQVLTVAGGRIVEIRGFDDRDLAARRAGLQR
jgi:ketosteroid isomerase-like protein